MGRARKQPTSVTVPSDAIQLLAERLGYKDKKSIIDDLAMGALPPREEVVGTSGGPIEEVVKTADSMADQDVVKEVESKLNSDLGKGSDAKVNQEATTDLGKEPSMSWADEVEAVGIGPSRVEVQKIDSSWADAVEEVDASIIASGNLDLTKQTEIGQGKVIQEAGTSGPSWLDVVKGNRANGEALEYFPPGMEVVITEEEWNEGEKMWKHTLAAKFGRSRPSYDELAKWVATNWKKKPPGISQLKPGIFLFEFDSEEMKCDVLMRN